jgi:hypothetical protein
LRAFFPPDQHRYGHNFSMARQTAKKKTIHDSAVPSRPGGLVASSWIVLSS